MSFQSRTYLVYFGFVGRAAKSGNESVDQFLIFPIKGPSVQFSFRVSTVEDSGNAPDDVVIENQELGSISVETLPVLRHCPDDLVPLSQRGD